MGSLLAAYRSGRTDPREVLQDITARIAGRGDDGVWISLASPSQLAERCAVVAELPRSMPLWGVPFAVKDSIDITGWQTTLACPDYAYTATSTAPVVQALLDAGAILVGKNNLDQFATGLNGTRSPYGVPRSVFGGDLISGGSSSGSAVAVALGEVPFALATDTAGSGRVPPALNGVVGYKPSRGLLSTVGLVPACRSLDCLSLITVDIADAALLLDVVAAVDHRDPWSRPRIRQHRDGAAVRVGLPPFDELEFFGDTGVAQAQADARDVVEKLWPDSVPVPPAPFVRAGELLYQGPWVAERFVEFGDFLSNHPASAHPVVDEIIRGGAQHSAADVFRAQYLLQALKSEVSALFDQVDVVVLPTIGTTFTVEQVLADPVRTNTMLGHYTHCGNLLDLCAVSVPAGTTADGRPVALMLLAPAQTDDVLLAAADLLSRICSRPVTQAADSVPAA